MQISRELVRLVRDVASDEEPSPERYRVLRNRLDHEVPRFDWRDLAEYNRRKVEEIAAARAARRRWYMHGPVLE